MIDARLLVEDSMNSLFVASCMIRKENPPAKFLYKMVGHVPHIKPFFYREFLVFFWMLQPVLYHFTFLDLRTSIL